MLPVPYRVRRMWTVLLIFQSLIICIRGDCGPPPAIENTLPVEETSRTPGSTVVYMCDHKAGYYELPDKSRTITCQDDGTWSPLSEFCARACDVPGRISFAIPKDGELDKDIFLPGTRISYDCVPGYRRVSNLNRITCLDNYTWSEPSDFCERKQCVYPGDTPNGEFTATNGFLFGSEVTYSCNRGYRLTSKRNVRVCKADGTWSNDVPVCEVAICPAPDPPVDGSFDPQKDQYEYLDAVTFTCKKNLHVIGESSASCTSNGTWSNSFPTCKAVECPDPGELQNGRRISGFAGPYTLNSAVRFECDKNYVLKGSSTITCTSNNKWDSELPECLPVECPDPGEVKNGRRISGAVGPYILNSAVRFECDKNYVLEGSSTITCTSNNKWDSDIPKCLQDSSLTPLSTGAIVGICIACLLALFGACCLCYCCSKKKSGNTKSNTPDVQYTACNDSHLRAKEDAMA